MSTQSIPLVTPYDYHDDDVDKKYRSKGYFEMFYSLRTLIISIVIGIITLFTIYTQISNSKSGYALIYQHLILLKSNFMIWPIIKVQLMVGNMMNEFYFVFHYVMLLLIYQCFLSYEKFDLST